MLLRPYSLLLALLFGISCLLVDSKQPCYVLKMLDFHRTETPYYRFEMELHKNLTISSVTRVLKEVPVPVWHLKIVQHTSSPSKKLVGSKGSANEKSNPLVPQEPKVLYNATYKTCDFWKYVKRIRVFNNVAQMVLSKDSTNMSMSCPMPVGTYVMRNIHVPPDTGLLKFMYWPNTVYTLFGTVYSQRSDKSLVEKCSYRINGTVMKYC